MISVLALRCFDLDQSRRLRSCGWNCELRPCDDGRGFLPYLGHL